jgi:hypothetical protein
MPEDTPRMGQLMVGVGAIFSVIALAGLLALVYSSPGCGHGPQ